MAPGEDCGPPYYVTRNLLGAIMQDDAWPTFDGFLASQGVETLALPLDRLLNLTYWWLTRAADRSTPQGQQALRKFDALIWRPPPGEAPETGPWSAEAETAAFRAFKAQVNPEQARKAAQGAKGADGRPTAMSDPRPRPARPRPATVRPRQARRR